MMVSTPFTSGNPPSSLSNGCPGGSISRIPRLRRDIFPCRPAVPTVYGMLECGAHSSQFQAAQPVACDDRSWPDLPVDSSRERDCDLQDPVSPYISRGTSNPCLLYT